MGVNLTALKDAFNALGKAPQGWKKAASIAYNSSVYQVSDEKGVPTFILVRTKKECGFTVVAQIQDLGPERENVEKAVKPMLVCWTPEFIV